jgi:hypothetical protein
MTAAPASTARHVQILTNQDALAAEIDLAHVDN